MYDGIDSDLIVPDRSHPWVNWAYPDPCTGGPVLEVHDKFA